MEERRAFPFLEGYRVLDLADDKGIWCGRLLGDFGADVIKIESPGGDPARNIGPFYHDIPDSEKSLFWFYTNLNKRGITLNIESREGQQIFKRLVKTADFVVESFEPGYMDSIGLGYAELERFNPRIIMTSITPFGQTGPYAHYKGSDLIGLALGGLVHMHGEWDRPGNRFSEDQFYYMGSASAFAGTTIAHYHRELTGEGQHVDTSCLDSIPHSLMQTSEVWDLLKISPPAAGPGFVMPRPIGILRMRAVFPCKDGYVVVWLFAGGQPGLARSSRALVEMANEEGILLDYKDYDWMKDYDAMTISQEERDYLDNELGKFLLTKTKDELIKEAVARGIRLMPVATASDVAVSSQIASRGFWVDLEHPELGTSIRYPGFPMMMSEFPLYQPQRRAPLIGEHNEEVYEKELGYSRQELTILKACGVI